MRNPEDSAESHAGERNHHRYVRKLEPMLAAKEFTNKHTKYRGTCVGNVYGWMMLKNRYLEKAHAKATAWKIIEFLDTAWKVIEFRENEARDFIPKQSKAERDTDEEVFALFPRRLGTGSSEIQIQ